MKLNTVLQLAREGQLAPLLDVGRLIPKAHLAYFVGAAASVGLLEMLRDGPLPFDAIAVRMAPEPSTHTALRAWLEFGVRLGVLRQSDAGYALKSRLAHRMARPGSEAAVAVIESLARLHHQVIVDLPFALRDGHAFGIDDFDGRLIARSSLILEPLVKEVLEEVVPMKGPARLLEVGCGAGVYIRYAAARNPSLTAIGLEIDPTVGALARDNMREWGLEPRVSIEVIDFLARQAEPVFDLVTLHNNLYYFPLEARPRVVRHAFDCLAPGGRLLVTSSCQGGSTGLQVLNIFASSLENGGGLPTREGLLTLMREAGFKDVRTQRLLPGEAYFAFHGTRPAR